MPALAITLSLDHAGRTLGADAEGDMVAFVSGLLLGNDQQVRNWFAMFVRNGQKVCEFILRNRLFYNKVLFTCHFLNEMPVKYIMSFYIQSSILCLANI
jgi:hypothetical protein